MTRRTSRCLLAVAALTLVATTSAQAAGTGSRGATSSVQIEYTSGTQHSASGPKQMLVITSEDVGGGRVRLTPILGEPAGTFAKGATHPRISLAISVVCPPATAKLQTAHISKPIIRFFSGTKGRRIGVLPSFSHTFTLCPGTASNEAVFFIDAKITAGGKTTLAAKGESAP